MKMKVVNSEIVRCIVLVCFLTSTSAKAASIYVPRLISPSNNAVTDMISQDLFWNNDPYQILNYQVQVANNLDFLSLIQNQTSSANQFTFNSPSTGKFYWRVRSISPTDTSAWSETRILTFFIPTSIPSLSVWLEPNYGYNLNGMNLVQMDDKSGHLNHAIQANSFQQPKYIPSDSLINNKAFMEFDGVDDFNEMLDNNTLDYTDQFSIFLLVKPRIIATNKTMLAKWDYQTQGSWAFQTDFNTSNELMFAPAAFLADPGNSKVVTSNSAMQAQIPTLINLDYDGAANVKLRYFKNLNLRSTVTTGSIPSSLPNSSASLKVGKYGGIATRYYDGAIGEVLIFDRLISDSIKQLVNGYLRSKYSPPVNLGKDTLISAISNCGNLQIKPQMKYQSYLWSNGSNGASLTVTKPGVFWVRVTDFLGNITSDTITVYSPFSLNYPDFNGQLCINTMVNWIPGFPSSNFTYTWHDNSTSSQFSIVNAGAHYVRISELNGCFYDSDTILVTIDNYPSTASLGNDTSLCQGNFIALQQGASQTTNYLWPDGSTTNNYAVDTTGNYYVQTTNINGCIAYDTIHITVAGLAPVAEFLAQNNCFGAENIFQDQSTSTNPDVITQWAWNFGDGMQSTVQSPAHTYAAIGNYTVQLYVQTNVGCGAFTTIPVQIYALPQSGFSAQGYCTLDQIQFTDTTIRGDGIVNQWAWNFGQPGGGGSNISTAQNPKKQYGTTGMYTIQMTATDEFGCSSQSQMVIDVKATPLAAFSFQNSCETNSINLTNTTTTQSPSFVTSYLWKYGDGQTSVQSNPTKSYATFGTYEIVLRAISNEGCVGYDTSDITIHPNPIAALEVGAACKSSLTELLDLSTIPAGSIASSKWYINLNDSTQGSPAYFTFSDFGQQQVVLKTISDKGCAKLKSILFSITEEVKADFITSANVVSTNESIQFTSTSIGAANYYWQFGDGATSGVDMPLHAYGVAFVDSTVQVILEINNGNGCRDTQSYEIQVRPYSLDLSLKNVLIAEVGEGYTVGVEMTNLGSTRITKAELDVSFPQIGKAFTETWTGSIEPGKTILYLLKTKPSKNALFNANGPRFICVDATGHDANGKTETDFTTNRICKNIENEDPIFVALSPNPATTNLNLQFILTVEDVLTVELINSTGQNVATILDKVEYSKGFHLENIDLRQLQAGVYTLKIITNGQLKLMRFVKE